MTSASPASTELRIQPICVGSYTSDSGRDGVGIGLLRLTAPATSTLDASDARIGLEWSGTAAAAPSPSFLAAHPRLPVVYAAQETDQTVRAFRQSGAATLEPFGESWPAGSAVCHVAVDRDARFLTAACWGDGRVLLYELDSDGAIASRSEAAVADDPYAALARAAVAVEEQAARQSRAHASLMLADGRVMTTDLGFDLVRVWRYESGRLALDHEVILPFGSGPRHLVQHPDGTVFVVTEYSVEVVALRADPAGPRPSASSSESESESVSESESSVVVVAAEATSQPRFAVASIGPATADGPRPGDAAAEIALSPDARFVYVTVRGSNRLSTLEVDAPGRLHPIADVRSGGDWPRHHLVVPLLAPAAAPLAPAAAPLAAAPLAAAQAADARADSAQAAALQVDATRADVPRGDPMRPDVLRGDATRTDPAQIGTPHAAAAQAAVSQVTAEQSAAAQYGAARAAALQVDSPQAAGAWAAVSQVDAGRADAAQVDAPGAAPLRADTLRADTLGAAPLRADTLRAAPDPEPTPSAVLLVAHERSNDIAIFTLDPATGIPQPHPGARLAVEAPTALLPFALLPLD